MARPKGVIECRLAPFIARLVEIDGVIGMSQEKVRGAPFTIGSFFLRLLFTLAVVMLTFNPTGYSYVHWLNGSWSASPNTLGPEHAVAGIALFGGWLIVVTATQRALGSLGLLVLAAFLAALVWWLFDAHWLTMASAGALEWITLGCLSILLAVGMSWSFIWRRMTGQYEVDEVNN
jgi:hypothetical protein